MTRTLLAIAALLFFNTSLIPAQQPTPAKTSAPEAQSAPYKVGGDVLPPKLTHSVEPKYPRSLFHKRKSSIVLVGLTVPADGIPIDIHIVKSGGAAFDKDALNAVQQYRFQPATLHNNPVPVLINVEVNFEIL